MLRPRALRATLLMILALFTTPSVAIATTGVGASPPASARTTALHSQYDLPANLAPATVADANGSGAAERPVADVAGASLAFSVELVASRGAGLIDEANFAQRTYSPNFSADGLFAGQTVDDVAAALRSGALDPKSVPINLVVRNGNPLILNTRSAHALMEAGVPRSAWNVIDQTGNPLFETLLSGQLGRNNLTDLGTGIVRRSGG